MPFPTPAMICGNIYLFADLRRLDFRCSTLKFVCSLTQYIQPSLQIRTYNARETVRKLRNQKLSLRRGPWRLWIWLKSMDPMKLECRCLRTRFKRSVSRNNYTRIYEDACSLWRGRDNLVGIAIRYGLRCPSIECWCGRFFLHLSRPVLRPTLLPVRWALLTFLGGKRPRRNVNCAASSSDSTLSVELRGLY